MMTDGIAPKDARRALHFDISYRETVRLKDGSVVSLRLVQPSDKQLLQRGLERLSPRSRYLRFFTSKLSLSEAELDYLTRVDNVAHLAIGAVRKNSEGEEEGLGIARFVRSKTRPDHAEAAVAVVDDWQNKGLGATLLLRLSAAAKERGIEYFTAEVLRVNRGIRTLLAALPPQLVEPIGQDAVQVRLELPEIAQDSTMLPEGSELSRVLRMTGKDELVVEPAGLRSS
ncbi:MAG TPA: GNAT family N-acetyltransferase [Polyangiaceae bacterium]